MDTDRRRFLAGVVTTAVVGITGCSGGGEEEPRPPREDGDGGNGNQDPARETAIYREVDALKPEVASFEGRENDDGNLTLVVELNNINPAPVEGTINATFATMDGEQQSYTQSFTLSEDGEELTMDIPVAYDEYTTNMSFPDFTFENVTER